MTGTQMTVLVVVAMVALTVWIMKDQWFPGIVAKAKLRKAKKAKTSDASDKEAAPEWRTTISEGYKKWWLQHPWIPIVVGVVIVNITLAVLQPTWWWTGWTNHLFGLLVFHFFFIIGLSMLDIKRGKAKENMGYLVLACSALCVLVLMNVYPATLVSETHRKQMAADAAKKADEDRRARQRIVVAKPDEYGEKITTMNREVIHAQGPIMIMDDHGREYEDDKNAGLKPTIVTTYVRVKSRTKGNVDVIIQR